MNDETSKIKYWIAGIGFVVILLVFFVVYFYNRMQFYKDLYRLEQSQKIEAKLKSEQSEQKFLKLSKYLKEYEKRIPYIIDTTLTIHELDERFRQRFGIE